MGGAAKPISEQQLYSPLRIWCIGLAITAIGVIASDLWLDQPIALFVHRTVADKTIFRLAAAASCRFFLAIFAHLRVVRLMDVVGAPSVARAVYRIGVQYYFHCDQPHNQSAQVRVWTDLARELDRKESLSYSKRSLWLQSFPRWTWLRIVPFGACGRSLCSDGCSLVVVCTLTSNLRCLCRCGCGRANWRELSFFERHSWRDLCWPFRRLRHDKNIVFENAFMS